MQFISEEIFQSVLKVSVVGFLVLLVWMFERVSSDAMQASTMLLPSSLSIQLVLLCSVLVVPLPGVSPLVMDPRL